jgi:NAD dependent epimerase/dehydratase family enzyme
MGQMGEGLLLTGKKILPDKIIKAGYKFKYEQLDQALKNVV